MKLQQRYAFKNWAGNIRSEVHKYFQPTTEQELIEVIQQYPKIRMVGTGHSWSAICATEEALVNLDLYQKILHVDHVNKQVKVQAGIKLWQLNEALDKIGLAMLNLGSIDQQSIVGAIATGTHGSGIDYQILASQVIEFSLIKASGEKIIVNKITESQLFNAIIVNLGCIGVISELTLQVTDAFNLHDYTTTLPFDEVIENLDNLLQQNNHFKLWWLPPTNEVVVYKYRRTNEPVNDSRVRQILQERILSVYVYRLCVLLAKWIPSIAKFINKLLTQNMKGPLDRIEKSYKVFIVPEPPIHRETEWSFDVTQAKTILKEYKQFIVENKYNLNFIQEIRFTKGDDFWLSACYGRDSLWLGLYCYEHENWNKLLEEYEAFARQHNGRPHWGKEFSCTKSYLEQHYEKYTAFIKLKQEFDPQGKFENDYIKRIF